MHWQNSKMLLAICQKKVAIFAATGNYFRPCNVYLLQANVSDNTTH